jgi:hypothetical protein
LTLTKEEIARARWLFGPAPILSSEEPERFEQSFTQLATALMLRDFIELLLLWHFACESWNLNRYTRHAAVAIERRHQEGLPQELQRARLQHAQKKEKIRAEIRSCRPADIAALAELEETIRSTADDMEEIHKRKASERDHNIAFEKSMAFQQQLDQLINSATRRRDDALAQLELYRAGLGARAKETADQILDGEYREVTDSSLRAPDLLAPREDATEQTFGECQGTTVSNPLAPAFVPPDEEADPEMTNGCADDA